MMHFLRSILLVPVCVLIVSACGAGSESLQSSLKAPKSVNQNTNKKVLLCINKCGDNKCQEVVCTGSGCPCAESVKSCAVDCNVKTK